MKTLSTVLALAVLALPSTRAAPPAGALPSSFGQIGTGPEGGAVWQGVIRNRGAPDARRPSVIYLPPGFSTSAHYPTVYLLHGFRGSPYSYTDGLKLAEVADGFIAAGLRPFVAVMPAAGASGSYHGEWAGVWENFVVRDVLPWVRAHLPAADGLASRAIAGLSAGGYGAVDIGLRHPRLFATLEAWSGYFHPIRDGPLADAPRTVLATHDPTLLVEREAPLLRRLGVRFFLSCGTTHDRVTAGFARTFAATLARLHLPHELWLRPGGHDGKFWRAQLAPALRYAVAPGEVGGP